MAEAALTILYGASIGMGVGWLAAAIARRLFDSGRAAGSVREATVTMDEQLTALSLRYGRALPEGEDG